MPDSPVNPIWKAATLILAGILVGGAPGYIRLLLDHDVAVTRVDVDREITVQNAAMVQELADIREELNRVEGYVRMDARSDPPKRKGDPK